MLRITLEVIFWIFVLVFGIAQYYASRYDKIIWWAASKIAPEGSTEAELNIYRAAIAPKHFHGLIVNLQIISPILVLALGTYLRWYLGLLGILISICVIYNVILKLINSKVDDYLLIITNDLNNRAMDYKTKGDLIRFEVAQDYADKLKELYSQYRNKNIRIPESGPIVLD